MSTPIIINMIQGHLVAAGPADQIRAALDGQAPLTITGAKCHGETVWLRAREMWGDDAVALQQIARTVEHPRHGTILYAWVDQTRLESAPTAAARIREVDAAYQAAEARAAAAVPACDNCGDCRECV